MKKIKEGAISRGLAIARVSLSAGTRAASTAMGNLFASPERKTERIRNLLISQTRLIADQMGQLKGSVMKVGQMLSMYGEHFFPPEVNSVLKSLQSQSPPLDWESMEPVLRKHLKEKLADLEINAKSVASASLGQVHRGTIKATGQNVVLKIQYPGVDKAIDSDLSTLKSVLAFTKILPRGDQVDEIFKEVRQMLHQEVDYRQELIATERVGQSLKGDPRYRVASTFPEFSTARVLTLEYLEGQAFDSRAVQAISQDRRNALALSFLDLYFRELFSWASVQTDAHFGNYKIQLGGESSPQDRNPDAIVLLDFGAVRKFSKKFLIPYSQMVQAALSNESKKLQTAAIELGLLRDTDTTAVRDKFTELCGLIVEPFGQPTTPKEEIYDWGKSDLPKRVFKAGSQYVLLVGLRTPPREFVFLDRKMSGVFIAISTLRAQLCVKDVRNLVLKYIEQLNT